MEAFIAIDTFIVLVGILAGRHLLYLIHPFVLVGILVGRDLM